MNYSSDTNKNITKNINNILEKIKKEQQEKIIPVLMSRAKTIMIDTLIEGFQEYYKDRFTATTVGSIYRAVLLQRVGNTFTLKVNPSIIQINKSDKNNTDFFWIGGDDNAFFEEDDDFDTNDVSEEDIQYEDSNEFKSYNKQGRQGDFMSKEQLCVILYEKAMDKFNKLGYSGLNG